MARPRRHAAAAILILVVSSLASGAETGISAAGALAWLFGGDLDLAGDMGVSLRREVSPCASLAGSIETRTAIRRASGFTFDVRDLEYRIDAGIAIGALSGGAVSLRAAQWGREHVDAPGEPSLRAITAGWQSAPRRSAAPGRLGRAWSWSLAAGPVIATREIDGDAVLFARGEWAHPIGSRVLAGFDLSIDALAGHGVRADLEGGPRLELPMAEDRRLALFVHGLRDSTPLGLRVHAIAAGFRVEEDAGAPRATPGGADIRGAVGPGGGSGRLEARLAVGVRSPRLVWDLQAAADVDGRILTARDTGDLFYVYHAGLQREGDRYLAGLFFHHRSNHTLAEPGPGVLSIDVLEAGAETPAWSDPSSRTAPGRLGALDAQIRAGALLDSSFGERRRWHAHGGARWTAPVPIAGCRPFLLAEIEEGDVRRRIYAAGVASKGGLEAAFEHLEDSQLFSADRTAWLVTVLQRF